MKEVVMGNVAYANDCIMWFYRIEPFSNLRSSLEEIAGGAKRLEKILKDVNMSGGFLILPSIFDYDSSMHWMNSHFNTYGNVMFSDLQEKLAEQILSNANTAINKDIYIYFIDGRKDISSSKSFSFFNGIKDALSYRTEASIEKMLSEAKKISQIFINGISNHYNQIYEIDSYETKRVLRYIDFPIITSGINYHSNYDLATTYDYQSIYTKFSDNVEKRFHSRYLALAQGENYKEASKGLGEIFNLNIPLAIHIKFDFVHDSEFINKIEQTRNRIQRDNKNYKKNMLKKDYQSEDEETQMDYLLSTAIETKNEWTMQWQCLIRMTHLNLREVNEYYNTTINNLRIKGFKCDTFIGRQDFAHENFKPYMNTMITNVFSTDLPYFCNLNILGNTSCGSSKGIPEFRDYDSKGRVLTNWRSIREQKTKNASTTFIVTGTTGSGKSMLVYFLCINAMIFSGYNIIFVYPKSDEVSLSKKIPFLKNYIKEFRIGDTQNVDLYKGVLDPLIIYHNNLEMGLSKVKELFKSYEDCYKELHYDESLINSIVESLVENGKRVNVTNVLKEIIAQDYEKYDDDSIKFAQTLLAREYHPMDSLFLGDDKTKLLDLSLPFNFIQLTNLPKIDDYDYRNINHVLVKLTINNLNNLIKEYINSAAESNENYILIEDEFGKMKSCPGYEEQVLEMPKTLRSANTLLGLVSQNNTDFDHEVVNNAGFSFIGDVRHLKQIDAAKDNFNISEDHYNFLYERFSERKFEDKSNNRRYPFIHNDYNDNSCIIESIIYNKNIFEGFDDKNENQKT